MPTLEHVTQAQVEQVPQAESRVEDSANPTDPVHRQSCECFFGDTEGRRLLRCARCSSVMRSRTCPLDGWIGARDSEVPIIGQIQKADLRYRRRRP